MYSYLDIDAVFHCLHFSIADVLHDFPCWHTCSFIVMHDENNCVKEDGTPQRIKAKLFD